MKHPSLAPAAFERLLTHLLSARGLDPDDAMDWIELHYDVQDSNDSTKQQVIPMQEREPRKDVCSTEQDDLLRAKMAKELTARAQATAHNKAVVFAALANAGITAVVVRFDGEGDSGQIEEITAFSNDKCRALPATHLDIQHVPWDTDLPTSARRSLRDAIEALCYTLLSLEHDGWENNDGAFGEFTFDVAEHRIALAFNTRYREFTTSRHTW